MFDSLLNRPRKLFWLIACAYVLLGLVYSWATPPFESSDEYKHFPVVQHIHQTGELVVLDPDNEGKWKQEGAQPPLYYLVMAAATSWIDTTDLDQVHIGSFGNRLNLFFSFHSLPRMRSASRNSDELWFFSSPTNSILPSFTPRSLR